MDGAKCCAYPVQDPEVPIRAPADCGRLCLGDGIGGGFGLVALAQRVRGAGAGLEVDGFLQQACDALHLELDCAAGDAPLVSAAHGAIRPCGSAEGDAT